MQLLLNLQINSLNVLTENYLRLLYSPSFSKKNLHQNINILKEINSDYLAAEQYARSLNFLNHMKLTCFPIINLIDENEFALIVNSYCDSDDFWIFRGRTLTENFCLFGYKLIKPMSLVKAEIFKIMGVISGVMSSKINTSPWPEHELYSDFQNISERFFSSIVFEYEAAERKILKISDKAESANKEVIINKINHDQFQLNYYERNP